MLDDQKKRKAISIAKQRDDDLQKVLDDHKNRNAKSIAKQREDDPQKVKEDQNRRKRLSRNKKKWKTQKDFQNMKLTLRKREEGFGLQKID